MKIPVLLFLLVFGIGLIVSPKIGVSWDEPDNIYASGKFEGKIYSQNKDPARYPPFPIYIGTGITLLRRATDAQGIITSFHIATALFFALLVATVYQFARYLNLSHFASLFAAFVTFLYPTLFGYGYSNIKDTAQAAMFTLALYLLVKKRLLAGGVAWGLALATKFNAVYVPLIWVVGEFRAVRDIKKFFFVFLVGLGVVFLVWPYLWPDPVGRSLSVIRYFTSVGQGYAVWWNGELFRVGSGQSLWWYPWGHLLVNTPIPILILSLIGLIRVIRQKKHTILLVWLLVPLVRTLFPWANFYDGLRHFVEILPALALLSAVSVNGKFTKILACFTLIQLLYINASLFPYSSGYYNMLAKNPNVNFDRDIEALSIREGMDYLHETYGTVRVWAPVGGHLSWYLVQPGDSYVYSTADADSIILVNKSSHIRQGEFKKTLGKDFFLDYTISRGNSIFAWVYRKR